MEEDSSKKKSGTSKEIVNCFWESRLFSKSYFRTRKNKSVRYYDNSNIFKFIFFHWLTSWMYTSGTSFIKAYDMHPLPLSDQMLHWNPIFSKHISDGILKLEFNKNVKSKSKSGGRKQSRKSILLRALMLTIWKRVLIVGLGLTIANVLSMTISLIVKRFLEILNDKTISFTKISLLLLGIVLAQLTDGLLCEVCKLYFFRLIIIIHYIVSFGIYDHSLCHRRKFSNVVNGSNPLNVCNQVLHSCSPESECSKSPLFCQARRYKNRDITPLMFSFETSDSYYIAFSFESFKYIIEFMTRFVCGIVLLSLQVKAHLWPLYTMVVVIIFCMIVLEIVNSYVFKFVLEIRDNKVNKLNDILYHLPLIRKMLYDDIAINIIAQNRNDELSLFFVYMFLAFFNMTLYTSCMNLSFYIVKRYFVKSVNEVSIITSIDTAGFITTFYILMQIITSMFTIPISIKFLGMAYVSVLRLENYVKDCPPNFYICDNKYTGNTQMSTVISNTTKQLPTDTVVYYKDATFTWVNSRDDLLNKNYEPYLKHINFELKRGQIAIVTGGQGSGKSNFIKSMLGEMTLIGGSMAVVPLHTSMPIFYASQDIWLQQGTVRSNITFGYKFDEDIYNAVLKAVELEFDISTWEEGDLRVLSDNAHSLSGGQRVRMELARAIYAYLIFHQVNMEYNKGKCSFLMCLDSSFQGLDPYVAKVVYSNLFSINTGLLMNDDLSIVLTTNMRSLDITLKSFGTNQLANCPIYNIKDQKLKFHSHLHDYMDNKNEEKEFPYLSPLDGPYRINYLTPDLLNCSYGVDKKVRRMQSTKIKYSKSFKTYIDDELGGVKLSPHVVYMSPAIVTFVIFFILSVGYNLMDNLKFIFSTNLSDYLNKRIAEYKDGILVDLFEVKSHCNFSLKLTRIFVSLIIILSFLATVFLCISCITSSRKIHEYCINSIFKYCPSVIKIKNDISEIITYIIYDISIVDDANVLYLSLFLFASVQTVVTVFTLFYLIPISIPIVIPSIIIIFRFVLIYLAESSRNLHLAYLECTKHLNHVYETGISGSIIFRSFKKELDLVNLSMEHRDYKARCVLMSRFVMSWAVVICNWITSTTTLLNMFVMLIVSKYTKFKFNVGQFGLALSLFMNVNKSFGNFIMCYAMFEIYMCSVQRFQYFVPPGVKIKFDKCLNTREEFMVNPENTPNRYLDKNQLLNRRSSEFRAECKRFYGLRKLFYNPKVHIFDVSSYLTREHTGVELRDVCVYTTADHNSEGMILKHVSASAKRSEIIGIIGRTGAGKTTLLSTLQNIVYNRTGKVLLDGKDLKDVPNVVVRQIIGVLPQLPFVFEGWTIRRFLDPRMLFSDDEINDALNQCGLLQFVSEIYGGKKLDTVIVGEVVLTNSSKSSEAQSKPGDIESKQTIESSMSSFDGDMLLSYNQLRTLWFARLILYRFFYRMIVVDEPPSDEHKADRAIENEISIPIYELLQKYFSHCTIFVTAHDSNVLKNCTSVWVLHDGSLVNTCRTCEIAENESIANIIEKLVH